MVDVALEMEEWAKWAALTSALFHFWCDIHRIHIVPTRDERDGASSCWQYWADSARK